VTKGAAMTDETRHHAANGTRSPLLRDDWSYIEPIPLKDFAPEDFALLDVQRAPFTAERQADEALRMLKMSENDPSFGCQINNFRHCLQSATMAHRAGKDDDYVAVALLHDIGFTVAPKNHGQFAATLLEPYITPETHWMLVHHAIFQNVHCRHHPTLDRFERGKWRGHPAFEITAEFVAKFDQNTMDPGYDNMPIEAFEPMVHRLFVNPPRRIVIE
jgi:predicted HD phosphohydrolase